MKLSHDSNDDDFHLYLEASHVEGTLYPYHLNIMPVVCVCVWGGDGYPLHLKMIEMLGFIYSLVRVRIKNELTVSSNPSDSSATQ